MQGYNCVIIYNKDRSRILFCKRQKEPYTGLFNFIGGKIEHGEDGLMAAYREMAEETGIRESQVRLVRLMDITYYQQDFILEVYAGCLAEDVVLVEEKQPLYWLDTNEDFFNMRRFAGEGNIGHMVEQLKVVDLTKVRPEIRPEIKPGIKPEMDGAAGSSCPMDAAKLCVGIDGCKGGWIVAVLQNDVLTIERFEQFASIVDAYAEFDELMVDMIIGLPGSKEHIRPDPAARKIIRERTSTIFPSPCRQAVYAATVAEAYDENVKVLGKKFTPLTVGIMPKMREIDTFLQDHAEYKNRIKESHPEVCFARLNGRTVMTKKIDPDGIAERIRLLKRYIPGLDLPTIQSKAKQYRCNIDDIIDAICLAVTANLAAQGKYEVLPAEPMADDTGVLMQMVIPSVSC